jgi:hypothetical protein
VHRKGRKSWQCVEVGGRRVEFTRTSQASPRTSHALPRIVHALPISTHLPCTPRGFSTHLHEARTHLPRITTYLPRISTPCMHRHAHPRISEHLPRTARTSQATLHMTAPDGTSGARGARQGRACMQASKQGRAVWDFPGKAGEGRKAGLFWPWLWPWLWIWIWIWLWLWIWLWPWLWLWLWIWPQPQPRLPRLRLRLRVRVLRCRPRPRLGQAHGQGDPLVSHQPQGTSQRARSRCHRPPAQGHPWAESSRQVGEGPGLLIGRRERESERARDWASKQRRGEVR